MAIVVIVDSLKGLKCGGKYGDRYIKIDFRGVSHYSGCLGNNETGETIKVNQSFTWNFGREVQESETLQLSIVTKNVLRTEKVYGRYGLVLQSVVRDGRVSINDALVDLNNQPIAVFVSFEIRYETPTDDDTSSYGMSQQPDDERQMLIDIEENIANLERSFMMNKTSQQQQQPAPSSSGIKSLVRQYRNRRNVSSSGKKTSGLRTVKNLMGLGKRGSGHQSGESSDCSETLLIDSRRNSNASLDSNVSSEAEDSLMQDEVQPEVDVNRSIPSVEKPIGSDSCSLKAQHYQVCITIIEARQLAGLNMDPVVCVQIGDERKYTSVKESTNCPYYNEYFVFDFHMPPVLLLDKIITLSVQQSRNILRSNLTLGSFKLDIATVWAQPDHQFYHKWALLTDAEDLGPKGYLKCDISVIGKGDPVKIPSRPRRVEQRTDEQDDDIEGNLLLPGEQAGVERQRARFVVKIYRADGLPKMNSSVMANVKKAFTGGQVRDLADPYVRVSFAGLTGKTSVKRNTYAPVWNEQVIFTEMFPPLCQRIKIQLRDNDPVNDSVIGTHFIDLKEISNDGDGGFLPTFGPAFVHLYGSTRDYSLVDRNSTLNMGLGEGISYRARLLIAIRTEISDNTDVAGVCSDVNVTQTNPVNEQSYATNEEFFLFAAIMDATMIDKKLGEKPMHFEMSIGNAGNTLDGRNESSKDPTNHEDSEESWHSTTCPTAKPMTYDRQYYFMPYWEDKPCLHVKSVWPDYRRRMYNSNVIGKIVTKLEEGLAQVESQDATRGEKLLKSVLDELCTGCNRYASISKLSGSAAGLGKTKLDKERVKLCQRELENIGLVAKKALTTKISHKESLKTARTFLDKLKFLLEDPQQSLPDVFIWLISSGKRVAYHRIAARDLIYSIVDEESGSCCATVKNMFLKLPGKKGSDSSCWSVQAKLQIYMWLGVARHKRYVTQGLPEGYDREHMINFLDRPGSVVRYIEKHRFQLRAHMYQARSLIGSDASGLSDPFARVLCGPYQKTTQVVEETLNPTWDELLIIDNIVVHSAASVIKKDPPTVVIEIFDRDKVGKAEFIGRTMARSRVKLSTENYGPPEFPPSLEWYRVTRGNQPAGELLAVFELLETTGPIVPESTNDTEGAIYPVPPEIRPTLSRYRIEILFWGLRDLRRIHLMRVDKPRVDIECAGNILHSTVVQNARKNPNFSSPIKFMDIDLPDQEMYRPPVTIRAIDCRSFGRYTLVGTHTINSIQKYINPAPIDSRSSDNDLNPIVIPLPPEIYETNKRDCKLNRKKSMEAMSDDSRDWWTKYFASIEEATGSEADHETETENSSSAIGSHAELRYDSKSKKNGIIKIYRNELEMHFNDFREWLDTFDLYRGKNSDGTRDESRVVGSFKGALRVYRMTADPPFSYFQSLPIPSNEPIHVLVRIYIVRANDLHPCDPNGKADPYVVLHLGDKVISDKDNYVSKQLNPVFGKCFEVEATFPQDSLLTVQILDWDLVGADDIIGETRIDLENRFYSKHRATCGLARQYDESGYNKWRDPMKPTQILGKLCKDLKLEPPSYAQYGRVAIGKKIFTLSNEEMRAVNARGMEEHLALAVLNRWSPCLVPEHVESRPLYNPDKPGIEQGRVDMWVDMFPMDMPLPGPPIDISPRKPKGYQLRIVILNTEDVVLEDDAFFTGEKMSDIYVKGWLKGSEDCQSTDIHHRSLTGEGNFNWRFLYPFDYLVAEERIVIRRKESLFSWDETEFKIPARLELQVWDADHFSADDFLGAITLDLNRFPRGAKSAKLCTLGMLKTDGSVPSVNIFKQKRVRGWWPFYVKKQNEDMELTGKVEAEIHLLTQEEAEANPAGYGRSEPDPLEKPSRPDASFIWLLNPIKSIRYIIWHNYKWLILKILITIALVSLVVLFLFAIPGYSVKKILGA